MGDKKKTNLRFWRKKKDEDVTDTKDNAPLNTNTNTKSKSKSEKRKSISQQKTPKVRHRGKSKAAQMALESGSAPIIDRALDYNNKSGTGTRNGSNNSSTGRGRGRGNGVAHFQPVPVTPPPVKKITNSQHQHGYGYQYEDEDEGNYGHGHGHGHDYTTPKDKLSKNQSQQQHNLYGNAMDPNQPSAIFTPKTLPATPTSSSPDPDPNSPNNNNKWQESDETLKLKAMARLHNLGREHAKHVNKKYPPNHTGANTNTSAARAHKASVNANANGIDSASPNTKQKKDQKIIDAVLGINMDQYACVSPEAKTAISKYASKPTSPSTVVNFQMLKQGSFQVLELAKESMGKLMNCAADLRDLDLNETMNGPGGGGRGHGHGHGDGDQWDEEEHEDDGHGDHKDHHQRHRRGRSLYRDEDDSYSSEDDGTFAGVSVRGRQSPVSHLNSGLSVDDGDDDDDHDHDGSQSQSEEETGGGHGMTNANANVNVRGRNREPAKARTQAKPQTQTQTYAHTHPPSDGATVGLTSFRSLREQSASNLSKGKRKHQNRKGNNASNSVVSGTPERDPSKYDVMSANPTTTNIPFDERSDIYVNGPAKELYEYDAYRNGHVVGGVGGHVGGGVLGLQLAESDMYARKANPDGSNDHHHHRDRGNGQHIPHRSSASEPRYKYASLSSNIKEEDVSICTDEREI